MSNRVLSQLIIIVITAMAILFALNYLKFYQPLPKDERIKKEEVQGVDIEYQNTPFTLNFEQQNMLINAINQAVTVENSDQLKRGPFSKLTIYRFGTTPIELNVLIGEDESLVFSNNGTYIVVQDPNIKQMLLNSYDA